MVEVIGIDSRPAYTVLWYEGDETRFKTVCYTYEEVKMAVSMSKVKGSFHYGRKYIVIRHENNEEGECAV